MTAVRRVLRRESGIALPMALLTMAVMTSSAVVVITMATANARSARYLVADTQAAYMAETGLAEAASILTSGSVDPYDPAALPPASAPRVSTYADGTVSWWGELDTAARVWQVRAVGSTRNPTGGGTTATQERWSAKFSVLPTAHPSWEYMYSRNTTTACTWSAEQSSRVDAPVYVNGNMCIDNTAVVTGDSVTVTGQVRLSNRWNSLGSSSDPVGIARIGGGCKYHTQSLSVPCRGVADNVFATRLETIVPRVDPPPIAWDDWYLGSSPGPYSPCATRVGNPPVFDNDQGVTPDPTRRNNSVRGNVDLTPAAAYTCRTAAGELSWAPASRVLTVAGVIYIDGSIIASTSAEYRGRAVIYATGTATLSGTYLCAKKSGTSGCDDVSWDTNRDFLAFIAEGRGQATSVRVRSGGFQGAIYGGTGVEIDTFSVVSGPINGDTISFNQRSQGRYPAFDIPPDGFPGTYPRISPAYDIRTSW